MSKMQMRNARELTPTKRLERIFGGPNIENIRIYSKNSKLVYHIIWIMWYILMYYLQGPLYSGGVNILSVNYLTQWLKNILYTI